MAPAMHPTLSILEGSPLSPSLFRNQPLTPFPRTLYSQKNPEGLPGRSLHPAFDFEPVTDLFTFSNYKTPTSPPPSPPIETPPSPTTPYPLLVDLIKYALPPKPNRQMSRLSIVPSEHPYSIGQEPLSVIRLPTDYPYLRDDWDSEEEYAGCAGTVKRQLGCLFHWLMHSGKS